MRALLSVTDKSGIVEFAKGLVGLGYELVSTGGTAKALREAGLAVVEVADVTAFPELLDGRVKTLHPLIHGGLLGDTRLETHRAQMAEAGIEAFQVVCVNLYKFETTVTQPHTVAEAVESIDIGGPAMIRASAKNSANVLVVVDPDDYSLALETIKSKNEAAQRLLFAAKAFRHTAFYDSMVSRYLSAQCNDPLPELLTMGYRKTLSLRYGENPHQSAALYQDPLATPGISQAHQIWGKELSYNNILDGDAAWELVHDLPRTSCAVIKHGNPCGAAACGDLAEGYRAARAADTVSAFGGVAAFSGVIDLAAAEAMTEKGNFLEVVIAEGFDQDALEVFRDRSGWGQNVRLLTAPVPPTTATTTVRTVRGGALVQLSDEDPNLDWNIVTKRKPTEDESRAMKFAWSIVPHVKSNAIVVSTGDRLLGAGAGQMNRVQSVRLALEQAGPLNPGAALASDAFFPFPDSIETAGQAGVTAIVQPGGSKKDQDSIDAADRYGMTMAFTGARHFRH